MPQKKSSLYSHAGFRGTLLGSASAAALTALAVLAAPVHAAPPEYRVTTLGTLNGVSNAGVAIDASGQVVDNYSPASNFSYPVVWTGAAHTSYGTLGGTNCAAYGINATGQLAGNCYLTGDFSTHAVRWAGTSPTDLGTLGGSNSYGYGINDSGQVVGTADLATSGSHATLWTGTTPTDLGTLGGTNSFAIGINKSGVIAGYSELSDSSTHAVRWTGTTPTDLGTLGGTNSYAYAINVAGQVAGRSDLANGNTDAVLWTGTTPKDLGTLGGAFASATAINASGEVVGTSQTSGNLALDAFVYTDGEMYDLSTLLAPGSGVTDLSVSDLGNTVNDAGQIAASGVVNGQPVALLLTPIPAPEPASGSLLACGAPLLGLRGGREQRRGAGPNGSLRTEKD